MDAFTPRHVVREIERLAPRGASGALCVALSGGLDSVVLLEALARGLPGHGRWRLRAVHVDHALYPDSADWDRACAQRSVRLDIPYDSVRVVVPQIRGESLEAAARAARYEALASRLQPGEILLTAHHADDQLETMLLALVRGAGLAGLAAMPDVVPFAGGWHARPLLSFSRAALEAWARAASLDWLDDPANRELRFDRNYLRHVVAPELRRRWPAVSTRAVRSARHLAEAHALLDEVAIEDLKHAACGRSLNLAVLGRMSAGRRRNLLRAWLRFRDLPAPATRVLTALEHDMWCSAPDRCPVSRWPGAELRRHRGLLYAMQPLEEPPGSVHLSWEWRQPAVLPAALGQLRAISSDSNGLAIARLPPVLRIGFRAGGERLRVAGRAHHRPLKKWLQELDVLPWYRDRVPLVFAGDSLLAVADRLIAHEFAAGAGEDGVSITWESAPDWRAERCSVREEA